jgi:hypothetical protein
MNLDEIQAQWREYDRKLDTLLQLNRRLLNADTLARASSALGRQKLWATVGIMTNAAVIPLVGLFIALNHRSLAFVVPAVAIDVYFIINLLVHAKQTHLLSRLDFAGPVIAIQRRVDEVVRLRIRFARWLALSLVLSWVPISIVVFKALLGWNLYSIAPAWLVVNAILGLCCIPLVLWASSSLARDRLSAPAQRFFREIAGEDLTAARAFLSAVTDFEQEERGLK